MNAKNKTVVIIAGPTAVGKTAMAIAVAQHFNTEIISADSRQCYCELNIGVARPSLEELTLVPHHFIATHSIHQKVTAAVFEKFALEKAEQLFHSNDVVVMVGGTGLYIKAFEEGLDTIPEIPDDIREEISQQYDEHGLAWLQGEVEKLDPLFYAKGEIKNPHRLLRALEVFKATGQSIVTYKSGAKKHRPFNIIKLALHLPKEDLHTNINQRVDHMISAGLEEEARLLIPHCHLTALQTVGYKELFSYFDGDITHAEAVETIKRNTRQYAKRQLTWFRKDPSFTWFTPLEQKEVLDCITSKL